jgi:hypothetical protein
MADARNLASEDVAALKALALHADRHLALGSRDAVYHEERGRLEGALSSVAREFWFATPSKRFRRMLSRFIPAYLNVKTTRGWTAYRYIRRRSCYASRACATGLSAPLEGWTAA